MVSMYVSAWKSGVCVCVCVCVCVFLSLCLYLSMILLHELISKNLISDLVASSQINFLRIFSSFYFGYSEICFDAPRLQRTVIKFNLRTGCFYGICVLYTDTDFLNKITFLTIKNIYDEI